MNKVGFYKSVKSTKPDETLTLSDAYELITSDTYKEATEYICTKHREGLEEGWKTIDKKEYQEDKLKTLPCVLFQGSFDRTGDYKPHPIEFTEIMNFDLDENTKVELDNFKETIVSSIPYIQACWRSVSGSVTGALSINVLIEIPSSYEELPADLQRVILKDKWLDKLWNLYSELIKKRLLDFNIKVSSARDYKRLRYVCYDPELYLNELAKPLTLNEISVDVKDLNFGKIFKKNDFYKGIKTPEAIMNWVIENHGEPVAGNRTCQLVSYFGTCNHHGVNIEDAITFASQYGGDYKNIADYIYENYRGQKGSTSNFNDDPLIFTDTWNGQKLVEYFGESIRYCYEAKGWMVYEDGRWSLDKFNRIIMNAKATVQAILDEYQASDNKEWVQKKAKSISSMTRLKAMAESAKSIEDVSVTIDIFDTDNYSLNLRNGTYDLNSGDIKAHDSKDMIARIAEVDYDSEAKAPLWDKFLQEIFDGNANLLRFIQRVSGYALTGDVSEQVLFILFGKGANGKTTFVEVIQRILKDYAVPLPSESLLSRKGDAGIPNDIARMSKARFVCSTETDEGRKFSESKVKRLTGSDIITARFLNKEFFDYYPTHKLFIATNNRPNITGTDEAIWRRIIEIPFEVTIPVEKRDKHLTEKLFAESSGILNWMIEGYKAYKNEGLNPPIEVTNAVDSFKKEMDVIARFIEARCETGNINYVAESTKLYTDYKEWAELYNEPVLSHMKFSQKLQEKGFQKLKSGTIKFTGIRLIADFDKPMEWNEEQNSPS
jgi:putative DNA primase/helicase